MYIDTVYIYRYSIYILYMHIHMYIYIHNIHIVYDYFIRSSVRREFTSSRLPCDARLGSLHHAAGLVC